MDITIESDHPDVQVVTQVTNITSGTDLAKRYYYQAKCENQDSQCSKARLEGVSMQQGYSNKFILMFSDGRKQLSSLASKLDKVNLKMTVKA